MKLLILSSQSIADTTRSIPDWREAQWLGTKVAFRLDEIPGPPDAIVSMSISRMRETWEAVERFPDIPLFSYNWDCYAWVWTSPRSGEYDYASYGNLLRRSREIWVPSQCTGTRTSQWWNCNHWKVIKSSVPYWDYEDVEDGGYLLCSLREIPDPWCNHFERACEELKIPYKRSNHLLSFQEYQKMVAHCRGLVSHYYELSTGGLTLLEGLYLRKPCLLSDSPWHGGRDYLEHRASYFLHGDYEYFKAALKHFYENPPHVPVEDREWVKSEYNDVRMVQQMLDRIKECL